MQPDEPRVSDDRDFALSTERFGEHPDRREREIDEPPSAMLAYVVTVETATCCHYPGKRPCGPLTFVPRLE